MPRNKVTIAQNNNQTNLNDFFTPSAEKTVKADRPVLVRRHLNLNNAPTILQFFTKQSTGKKRKRFLDDVKDQQSQAPQASIAIPYRDDGYGRGALYDHRAVQNAVKKPTTILNLTELSRHFKDEIQRFQYILKFGENLDNKKHKYPPIADFSTTFGLLLLPGVSAKEFNTPSYQIRKAHEQHLIKQARLQGRPILAICGGSWVLYQQFGGTIIPVTDHAYRAGMPRLSPVSGKIINNKQIHRIAVTAGANLLRSALHLTLESAEQPAVNSIHSWAPDSDYIPKQLIISARTVQDDDLAPINAKATNTAKEKMKPEANSVEAFESAFGAPILGVQWHPEAYCSINADELNAVNHEHLMDYMEKAGQTFLNKQHLLKELEKSFAEDFPQLKSTTLIAKITMYYAVFVTTK